MRLRLLFALTTALAAAPPIAAANAQVQKDWTRTVGVTPEGGFRMGNPAAPVKVVEYGSLTCSHCADFAREAMPKVAETVRSGRVSFEFRNFVRDSADLAATLLSRCASPERYFAVTERMFAAQPQWMQRMADLPQAQRDAIAALPPAQRIGRIAEASGLMTIAAQGGVNLKRGQLCLVDEKGLAKIADLRRTAIERDKLEFTPTFLINGKRTDGIHDWATLQPHLQPPGG
jgi:hypothetical protein